MESIPPVARVAPTDPSVQLRGSWDVDEGGVGSLATDSCLSLEFEGEYVRVIGRVGPEGGVARVEVVTRADGRVLVDRRIDTGAKRQRQGLVLFAAYNLPPGRHELRISRTQAPGAIRDVVGVEAIEFGGSISGTRYIDSRPGANGSSAGPGTTPDAPWSDFSNLRGRTLAPGARILLARGASWDKPLGPLFGAGTRTMPITIGAYGDGSRPAIIGDGRPESRAIWLDNPTHWVVEDLEIARCGAGVVAHFSTTGHRGLRLSRLFTHDNDVIHWYDSREWEPQDDLPGMFHGASILITGQVPVTDAGPIVEDVLIEDLDSVNDSNPVDIAGFNPGAGNLEFLHRDLGTHTVRDLTLRGCRLRDAKGAINLDNVENVEVLGCEIRRMCCAPQIIGTTSLFLWSVKNVNIIGSSITDVPDTGSPDGTACDLEAFTRDVRFLGNFMARNAGSGIEVLAIAVPGRPDRPDDHAVDLAVLGNVFADNVRKHRDDKPSEMLGSLHLRNDVGSPMSGLAERNVYLEPTGFIDDTHAPSHDWRIQGNEPAMAPGPFASGDMAAPEPGNPWTAGYVHPSGRVEPLHWDAAQARWGDPRAYVDAFRIHPMEDGEWTARLWTAPVAGRVAIRGIVVKFRAGGSPVLARICIGDRQLWPDVSTAVIDGLRRTYERAELDAIAVRAGDQLRFEVKWADTSTSDDPTSWMPIVAYTAVEE